MVEGMLGFILIQATLSYGPKRDSNTFCKKRWRLRESNPGPLTLHIPDLFELVPSSL